MNPDTAELAELAVASSTRDPAIPVPLVRRRPSPAAASASCTVLPASPAAAPALLRGRSDARRAALHDTWQALWRSRALIWVAVIATLLLLGYGPERGAFNPPGVTRGFGTLGDLLAAPAARWDSAWYLVIAHFGYHPELGVFTAPRTAFFPLYPLGIRVLSASGLPLVLAGVLLSTAAFACALYGIHRLTTLELDGARALERAKRPPRETARLAVLLTAFAPMAFYLSAVYAEALFLALSVGVFWCARHGRWALVGVLGALAGATRSAGLVLVLPALILYLYGPREDRAPDRAPAAPKAGPLLALRPRYRVRRDVLWLALLPAGVILYGVWLALAGGSLTAPLHSQEVWGRHFAGPFVGVWDGVRAAFDGARQLLSFQRHHVYLQPAAGSPFVAAGHNLMLLAFLLAAVPAVLGVLRTLPVAYGAYVLAALAMPLSYPVPAQPLMSLPRFLLVLFPLNMWLATWLSGRRRTRAALLALSSVLLAFFAIQFATWHWVA